VFTLFLQDIWKVLLYSLLLGAGLPVVYALGVRALAHGTVTNAEGVEVPGTRRSPAGVALAAICFVVVIAAIAVGLTYIVAAGHGEKLSFEHVYPTFVPKS
jgi:hypothetical protein